MCTRKVKRQENSRNRRAKTAFGRLTAKIAQNGDAWEPKSDGVRENGKGKREKSGPLQGEFGNDVGTSGRVGSKRRAESPSGKKKGRGAGSRPPLAEKSVQLQRSNGITNCTQQQKEGAKKVKTGKSG